MVIGFCGRMGVGKTTAARFTKLPIEPFAGALKDLFETAARVKIDKSKHRRHLQMLGTDIIRSANQEAWLWHWTQRAYRHFDLVVDDVRFLNEAALIHALGGAVVRIHRDGGEQSEHESETQSDLILHDDWIYNDGTLEDLRIAVENMMEKRYGFHNYR